MAKPKDDHFKDQETESFYLREKVLKFQELNRSEKQSSHRKIFLIRQAKNWSEIVLYFPLGTSGSRLEKLDKNQYSIRLTKKYRLLFKWNKEKRFAYEISINPHDKSYGKQK